MIDPASRRKSARFQVGGRLEFAGADARARLHHVENKNQIAVIDVKTKKVTGALRVKGARPDRLAYVASANS